MQGADRQAEKPYVCTHCHKAFKTSRGLQSHETMHTAGTSPNQCSYCEKSFSTKGYLNIHLRIHRGEKPYKCDSCEKAFVVNSQLGEHRRTHTGEMFECKLCDKSFFTRNGLRKHVSIHTGERPHACEFCQRTFRQKYTLKLHVRQHTGEKPHQCRFCDRCFIQNIQLKLHERTHAGEKPYQCDVCQKKFSDKSNRDAHTTRIHKQNCFSEEMNQNTSSELLNVGINLKSAEMKNSSLERLENDQISSDNNNLEFVKTEKNDNHEYSNRLKETERNVDESAIIKTKDSSINQFVCNQVDLSESYLDSEKNSIDERIDEQDDQTSSPNPTGVNLDTVQSAESEVYQCYKCQMSFKDKHLLNIHIQLHWREKPFKCDLCEKSFFQKSHLEEHKRGHTGEFYHCEVCDKSFFTKSGLKKHLSVHTGERPHVCEFCQRTFRQKYTLKLHVRQHTGEKPHQCRFCDRCFIQNIQLKLHERTHSGEKPYECKVCQEKFSDTLTLDAHKLQTHKQSSLSNENAQNYPTTPSDMNISLNTTVETKSMSFESMEKGQLYSESYINENSMKWIKTEKADDFAYSNESTKLKNDSNSTHSETVTSKELENRALSSNTVDISGSDIISSFQVHMHENIDQVVKSEVTSIHEFSNALTDSPQSTVIPLEQVSNDENVSTAYISKTNEYSVFSHNDETEAFINTEKVESNTEVSNKPKKSLFHCELCEKTFVGKSALKQHLSIHSGEKQFKCDFCEKSYRQKYSLSIHLRVHSGEKPFECDVCHKRFSDKSNRDMHLRVHSEEKPFKCSHCDVAFARNGDLTKHIKGYCKKAPQECVLIKPKYTEPDTNTDLNSCHQSQTDKKPFNCQLCLKSFTSKSYLKIHARMHKGERPYKCEFCAESFFSQGQCTIHKRKHMGERFPCELCQQTFASKTGLKKHLSSHTGERPFQCEFCEKNFRQREGLKAHTRIHTGEKPFPCKFCASRFSQSSTLKLHERKHIGEKPFECKFCHKTYCDQSNLKMHLQFHHRDERPYKCQSCEASFLRPIELKQHQLTHMKERTYFCQPCKQPFSQWFVFLEHKRQHANERSASKLKGPKTYQCHECGKSFDRKSNRDVHLLIHNGVKAHRCGHCDKAFVTKGNLKNHLMVHQRGTLQRKFSAQLDSLNNLSDLDKEKVSNFVNAQPQSVEGNILVKNLRATGNADKLSGSDSNSSASDAKINENILIKTEVIDGGLDSVQRWTVIQH